MKKALAILLTGAMAVTLLGGCSGGGSTGGGKTTTAAATAAATTAAATTAAATTAAAASSDTTAAATEAPAASSQYAVTEPITIQWWHALEDQYSQTVVDVVDEFNKSQDLITVEAVYIGNYSAVNEALVAAHAAGTGLPAITVANGPNLATYAEGGLPENLEPYIADSGYDVDDFAKGMIDACTYQGTRFALPFLISTQTVYYNKDLAKELNVTVPEKFEDMDAFLEATTEFNADGTTKRYGAIIPGWDNNYFETLFQNQGLKLVNDDQISTDLGSEKGIEIVKKIKEWCEKGYIYWASGTNASSIMRQHFIDKEAFSVFHTTSLYDTYVDRCDFEVGMAWLPGGDTKNQEIGGSLLIIPSKNDQATKNAAWQFLMFLCGKDVNMKWADETGYLPTRNSVLKTDEGVEFLERKPEFENIFKNLDIIYPKIQHPGWSQMTSIWKSYMSEIMIEDVDIESKIEDMVEEINEVLEDS